MNHKRRRPHRQRRACDCANKAGKNFKTRTPRAANGSAKRLRLMATAAEV